MVFSRRRRRERLGDRRQVDLAEASRPCSKIWENLRGDWKNLSCHRER
jgi:hypothetical protein